MRSGELCRRAGAQVPQGRRIGPTLMDQKWLETIFLLLLSFSTLPFLQLSYLMLLSFLFSLSVSFSRTSKELSSVTA